MLFFVKVGRELQFLQLSSLQRDESFTEWSNKRQNTIRSSLKKLGILVASIRKPLSATELQGGLCHINLCAFWHTYTCFKISSLWQNIHRWKGLFKYQQTLVQGFSKFRNLITLGAGVWEKQASSCVKLPCSRLQRNTNLKWFTLRLSFPVSFFLLVGKGVRAGLFHIFKDPSKGPQIKGW